MRKHRLVTMKKKYSRYEMTITQHVFIENGRKIHGAAHWVVMLDDIHIVLNTIIPNLNMKVSDYIMDDYWNRFLHKYNRMIDVYDLLDGNTKDLTRFNEYNYDPHRKTKARTDIDQLEADLDVALKAKSSLVDKVQKLVIRLKEVLQALEALK